MKRPLPQHLARGKQRRKAPVSSVHWVFRLGSYSARIFKLSPAGAPDPAGGRSVLQRNASAGRGSGPERGGPAPSDV